MCNSKEESLAMDWTCAKKTNKQHHQGISEMDSRRQKKARPSKDHLEKDCRVRNEKDGPEASWIRRPKIESSGGR